MFSIKCQMQNQAYWQSCMGNESVKKRWCLSKIEHKQIRSQRSQIMFVTWILGNRTESLVAMEPWYIWAASCSAALSSVDIASCLHQAHHPAPSCSAQPKYLMSVIKTVPKLWWSKDRERERESGRGTYFSWQFVTSHLFHCTNIVALFTYILSGAF